MSIPEKDVKEILDRYKAKIKKTIKSDDFDLDPDFSKEYNVFRKHYLSKKLSLYEKLCNTFESIIRVRPKESEHKNIVYKTAKIAIINPDKAPKLAAPIGVIFKWVNLMLSDNFLCSDSFGLTLIILSKVLHNFSYNDNFFDR